MGSCVFRPSIFQRIQNCPTSYSRMAKSCKFSLSETRAVRTWSSTLDGGTAITSLTSTTLILIGIFWHYTVPVTSCMSFLTIIQALKKTLAYSISTPALSTLMMLVHELLHIRFNWIQMRKDRKAEISEFRSINLSKNCTKFVTGVG